MLAFSIQQKLITTLVFYLSTNIAAVGATFLCAVAFSYGAIACAPCAFPCVHELYASVQFALFEMDLSGESICLLLKINAGPNPMKALVQEVTTIGTKGPKETSNICINNGEQYHNPVACPRSRVETRSRVALLASETRNGVIGVCATVGEESRLQQKQQKQRTRDTHTRSENTSKFFHHHRLKWKYMPALCVTTTFTSYRHGGKMQFVVGYSFGGIWIACVKSDGQKRCGTEIYRAKIATTITYFQKAQGL